MKPDGPTAPALMSNFGIDSSRLPELFIFVLGDSGSGHDDLPASIVDSVQPPAHLAEFSFPTIFWWFFDCWSRELVIDDRKIFLQGQGNP